MNIHELVYQYPTVHKEGFTQPEIKDLLKNFSHINMDKFDDALNGITCLYIHPHTVIYHHDIEKALECGVQNRDLGIDEWD